MDLTLAGLPITVALAAVAVIGYLIGRTQRLAAAPQPHESTRRELKRARAIIYDLELIAQHVRRDLAQHHTNLVQFKSRVDKLAREGDAANWNMLCDEADRLLKPTQDLAAQLALAYDGIRQQSGRLMTFTGQRCDALTGLCNRQALDESLENYLALHHRYGQTFSLAVFDLDAFQQINNEHGHLHGDRVLKQVAALLDESARETDLIARLGGEEFIAVLPGADLAGAGVFAERIRQMIDSRSPVTLSAGVATVEQGDDSKSLLTRADSALYAAKAAGRNRVFCHTGQNVLPCQNELDAMEEAADL
jgi:diguanylate cyclase (GGDEF)-like protein